MKNGSKKMPRFYWFAFMDACLLPGGSDLQPMAGCLHFITISGWISRKQLQNLLWHRCYIICSYTFVIS